ncbi:signal recognition particle receptor FtsY [Enterococcus saigonensis]|uniref:Signal recognition particle receptor FtsY n=1 Tax=Enterococcus saigonensis TaxID=1805431 RepID=A0A679IAS2_9ENTE|nr:signal recognition particle-docking protein FtsY [Enterococcus saigonensis]BCA86738.1 signal recognition particle receptor FtsY [Enterococcus saigonensis]
MGFFDKIKKALMGENETKPSAETPVAPTEEITASESEQEKATTPVKSVPEILSDSEKEKADEGFPAKEDEKSSMIASSSKEDSMASQVTKNITEEKNSADSAVEKLDKNSEEQALIKTEQPEESISVPPVDSVTTFETQEKESKSPNETIASDTVQEKYDKGLKKSRKTFGQRLNELFANFRSVDEEFFEEVEETLIGADVGFEAAMKIADDLRQEVKLRNVKKPAEVQNVMIEKLVDLYDEAGTDEVNTLNIQPEGLTVMLFVGVNGVGKTTSIGKLAYEYKQAGKKVLLAAADTFRAGAIDQLVVWGQRAGVEVVRGNAGGDPAAVVYDAMEKAKVQNADILLVDTAGRLQNKVNLMNELEKIKRVIKREAPDAPHEVLLVLDATTGQNAMVQAKQFKETTDVTGLILTKLDGTAKGGIVLAIRNELHLPVKLVGLGEGIDDLEPFDPNEFIVGLFKGLIKDV